MGAGNADAKNLQPDCVGCQSKSWRWRQLFRDDSPPEIFKEYPACSNVAIAVKIWYDFSMDIELTGFSEAQQQALFDLLILAMYADGHLTSFEDEQLQQVLATMGFVDEIDRQREFDAAVTRIRPSIQSIHQAKQLALELAEVFKDRKQQQQVLSAVEQMMTSDNNVSTWENTLLMELRMKFRL